MSEAFLAAFRNIARGGLGYRSARHGVFQAAQLHGLSGNYELGAFLREQLLKLKKGGWIALAFDDKDWKALDAIRSEPGGYWLQLYLPLLLDYVSANTDRVRFLREQSDAIGVAMLNDDGPEATRILQSLGPEDSQSLFAFRAQAVQYSFDAERAATLLRSKLKTDWLRKRYLYPLIFQAVASPTQEGLEDIVAYVVSGDDSNSEREALRLLLRDDVFETASLAFKAYVALLCHPYDAFEILLNHIEQEVCVAGALTPVLEQILARLHAEVPSSRTAHLTALIEGGALGFSEQTHTDRLSAVYGLDARAADLIGRIATTSVWTNDELDERLPKPMAALVRMRARKYPVPDDFNYLVMSARSWWFCEGGRLLGALLTSIYMLPRGNAPAELRDLLRLAGFLGAVTPFVLSSPSADMLRTDAYGQLFAGLRPEHLESLSDPYILPPDQYPDRMWIKAVHWMLRSPNRRFAIAEWLEIVRREIRIAPAFLTGIDWSWLDLVIKKARLRPFIGDPTGLYALLLFKIEERDRRSGALRTAIEPIVDGRSLPEVVDWLIAEYGVEAIAFARFLLEVDDLLWLGLAPNRTAALAGRIYALERCIRQFKYTELLPETLFKQEWETLNSALLLLSVNAGQFEIPWSVFVRDVASKQHDLYTAAHSLEPVDANAAALASARVNLPYRFRNERIENYTYPHRLAPLVALILAVVEDFLAHPAFGLEMILSTRFRHDTMRREFAAVLENVAEMSFGSGWTGGQREIVEAVEKPILATLDEWLDERMQTARPGKPKALFDVIPSPDQMIALAENLDVSKGVDIVIGEIVGWVRDSLERQLPAARKVFESEVPALLDAKTQSEKARLLEERALPAVQVEKVLGTMRTALLRRAHELVEWFRGEPEGARPPLTLAEIKAAADGLFEAYRERRGYRSYVTAPASVEVAVPAEKVRPVFDLLREVLAAALDHSGSRAARVRMQPRFEDGVQGFLFSNLTSVEPLFDRVEVPGDPYESLNDVIFREGDSGLPKIAALAATAVGRSVSVIAVRRARSFHLFVPFASAAE